jgi:hypothetical protein
MLLIEGRFFPVSAQTGQMKSGLRVASRLRTSGADSGLPREAGVLRG